MIQEQRNWNIEFIEMLGGPIKWYERFSKVDKYLGALPRVF